MSRAICRPQCLKGPASTLRRLRTTLHNAPRHCGQQVNQGYRMPIAPQRVCACGSLNCDKHKRQTPSRDNARIYDKQRADDPLRRFYFTARWRRVRGAILRRDPFCKIAKLCLQRYQRVMPSAEVDHITPVREGGAMYDPENLQGACNACHSWKTATEQGAKT